jgi:hypothetical protein
VSPTVLRSGPYRVFFFASDRDEPLHVHVRRDDKLAKFWLQPVRESYNCGFVATELNRVAKIVEDNESLLLKAWHEYFGHNGSAGGGKQGSRH